MYTVVGNIHTAVVKLLIQLRLEELAFVQQIKPLTILSPFCRETVLTVDIVVVLLNYLTSCYRFRFGILATNNSRRVGVLGPT